MYMTVKSECAFELTLNSAMLGVSVVEGGVKEWELETVGAPSVNRRREREVILAKGGKARRSPQFSTPPSDVKREPLQNRTSGVFCTVRTPRRGHRSHCASGKAREPAVSLCVLSGLLGSWAPPDSNRGALEDAQRGHEGEELSLIHI